MPSRTYCAMWTSCLFALVLGCSGQLDTGAPPPHSDPESVGPYPLQRLTTLEYRNTLRDLFGTSTVGGREVETLLSPDPVPTNGFATASSVSDVVATQLRTIAEGLTLDAPMLAGCLEETETCARQLATKQGRQLYRRPLTTAEVDVHVDLYRTFRGLGRTHPEAMRDLLGAMLQAPDFLYHWEMGAASGRAGQVVPLEAHALASRLAFFLWRSVPDEELNRLADSGAIMQPSELERQTRRLLAHAKARAMVAGFHRAWLGLDALEGQQRDPMLYPNASPAVFSSMLAEMDQLTATLVLDEDATVDTLLTTTVGYVDERLAPIYGIAAGSPTLVRTDLGPRRRGILTRAAVLALGASAVEGNPTTRGVLIRQRLLCGVTGSPAAGVAPLPPPSRGLTVRQRHEQHFFGDPSGTCAGCHRRTDYIGFGFGHFDAIGEWQETEFGLAINTSGTVVDIDREDVSFRDHNELIDIVADSEAAQRCIQRQWFRFAIGRTELSGDRPSMAETWSRFEASDFRIRDLIVSIALSRSFRNRLVQAGE